MIYLKPQIKLPAFPIINIWIQSEYDKLKSEEEIIEFTFSKFKEMENTNNLVRKEALKSIAYSLYSIITNKSYQSRCII